MRKHFHDHARVSSVTSRLTVNVLGTPPSDDKPRVLEWSHVSLQFEGRQVLNDIDVSIVSGELTCLCGSNGAGKTQLIRIGLGLVAPSVGQVKLLGGSPVATRRRVGYVPQLKAFNRNVPATVEDVLISAMRGAWPLFLRRGERDRAAHVLQRVGGLTLLDKDLNVLSGGELQRVFMARALLQNPEILILDEPLAAIDTAGRSKFMDLMEEIRNQGGVSILLITHSEAVVRRLGDRAIFLEKGRLVGWGHVDEMLSVDSLRESAFFGHDHESVIHGEEG
jgi:ABC-type Mn2+/Zn2+ transport system ATPase subunit